MALTESQRRRNKVAALSKNHSNPAELVIARRDLAAANLEAYVKKTVDKAPQLTQDQAVRIAVLLRGGAA